MTHISPLAASGHEVLQILHALFFGHISQYSRYGAHIMLQDGKHFIVITRKKLKIYNAFSGNLGVL